MGKPFRIYLFGPFDVVDTDGFSVRPSGRKECALIAALASSPNLSRTRDWLKSLLWSERDEEHASASLRQCVRQIKKSLPTIDDFLLSGAQYISLNASLVEIQPAQPTAGADFLEGMDIRDEAFESWLRLQRSRSPTDLLHDAGSRRRPQVTASAEARPPQGVYSNHHPPSAIVMPVVTYSRDERLRHLAESAVDEISMGIFGCGFLDIVDLRAASLNNGKADFNNNTKPIVAFRAKLESSGCEYKITLEIFDPENSKILAYNSTNGDLEANSSDTESSISKFVTYSIEIIHNLMVSRREKSSPKLALFVAINKFFTSCPIRHSEARQVFENLKEISGIARAFLAYAEVVAHAERIGNGQLFSDQHVREHCSLAVEQDFANPVVRAVIGHVHAFAFRDFDAAGQSLEIARNGGRSIPLVWSLSAMQRIYIGRFDEALAFAERAVALGQYSPCRFFYESDRMIAYALTEKHALAISAGQRILDQNPSSLAILRHMAASQAALGEVDEARSTIRRVQAIDRDFTYQGVGEHSYPLPAKKSVAVIKSAFEVAGLA